LPLKHLINFIQCCKTFNHSEACKVINTVNIVSHCLNFKDEIKPIERNSMWTFQLIFYTLKKQPPCCTAVFIISLNSSQFDRCAVGNVMVWVHALMIG